MPFYEYQCANCGHHLEAMQKINDPPMRKCPHCGKSQLQKLMSAPVFRLKGGGWYETDFKSDQDNKRNLADRPEEAPKEEKKKDSTEAATKETPAADAAKPDKSPEKPAEKAAPAEAAKKSTERPASGRGGPNKSNVRKRQSRAPVKRKAPKPARRR